MAIMEVEFIGVLTFECSLEELIRGVEGKQKQGSRGLNQLRREVDESI